MLNNYKREPQWPSLWWCPNTSETKYTSTRLLVVMFTEKAWWALRQLLAQLHLLFEVTFEDRGWSKNPLDFDLQGSSSSRACADPVVLRQVCQGEGIGGSKRSSNRFAFARAYTALRSRRGQPGQPGQGQGLGRKGQGQLNVALVHRRELLRMNRASQLYFPMCRALVLSADATRLSGLERLLVCLIGRHKSLAVCKAAWCPPQVYVRPIARSINGAFMFVLLCPSNEPPRPQGAP